MNEIEEIKVILDYLKDDNWDYYPSDGIPYKVFLMQERDSLLDYITNLQQKVEQLENKREISGNNFHSLVKNYRNLQKQNEQLENIIKDAIEYLNKREYDNYSCSVCSVMSDDLLNIINKGSDIND